VEKNRKNIQIIQIFNYAHWGGSPDFTYAFRPKARRHIATFNAMSHRAASHFIETGFAPWRDLRRDFPPIGTFLLDSQVF